MEDMRERKQTFAAWVKKAAQDQLSLRMTQSSKIQSFSLNILSKLKALTRYRNLVVLFSNANLQLNTEVQYKHMFCNAWITGGEAEDRSLSEALVIYTKLHVKYLKEYAINQLAINSDL